MHDYVFRQMYSSITIFEFLFRAALAALMMRVVNKPD